MKQHCLAEVTHINGPPHSDMALMVSPAVPTTPSTPRGASRAGRREEATAVVFRRAKPPATTGKLTEEEIEIQFIIFMKLLNSPPGQLFLQVANTRLSPICEHCRLSGSSSSSPLGPYTGPPSLHSYTT